METGTSWGLPRTGGTPGTMVADEITCFKLTTDKESDFSQLKKQKNSWRAREPGKVLKRAEITEV